MDRIQLRRDTSARWAEINPILLEGEVGFEIDTKLRKIGDGVNRWNDLEYLKAEGISQETGDSENATMSQKAITRELTELGSEVGGLTSLIPTENGGNLFDKSKDIVKSISSTSTNIFENNVGLSAIIEINGKAGDVYACKNINSKITPNAYLLIATNDYSVGASIINRSSGNYISLQGSIVLSADSKYLLINVNFQDVPSDKDKMDFVNTLVVKKQNRIPTEYESSKRMNVGFNELSEEVIKELKDINDLVLKCEENIAETQDIIPLEASENIFDKIKMEIKNLGATSSYIFENPNGVAAILGVNANSGDSFSAKIFDESLSSNNQFYLVATNSINNNDAIVARSSSTGSLMRNEIENIPQDAKYILVCINFADGIIDEQIAKFKKSLVVVRGSVSALPEKYISNSKFSVGESDLSDDLKRKISSNWRGNNIVWYGTSIPQGNNNKIQFNGNEVKALGMADSLTLYKDEIPNQYPVVVGSILESNIYNESVESSRVVPNRTHSNLQLRCKALGNKVSEIIEWLLGSYNIDWVAKTYSRKTDNNIGITAWFSDSSWGLLMWQFYSCLRYSFELSIVARYLIKDDNERDVYVRELFGNKYNLFRDGFASAGYSIVNLTSYKADIDLFVFDHGHNDSIGSFTGNTDDANLDTFEGCMNTFIDVILYYKPDARIAIVSDYTNYRPSEDRISGQKRIADKWQLPFIDLRNYLPLTLTSKVTTRGYWSADGRWHEKGFTWSESGNTYTSNNQFAFMLQNTQKKGDTLENVKSVFNPHQLDDGTWVWDAFPLCLWLCDGLHPSSDTDGRVVKLYGRVLAEWIKSLGGTPK